MFLRAVHDWDDVCCFDNLFLSNKHVYWVSTDIWIHLHHVYSTFKKIEPKFVICNSVILLHPLPSLFLFSFQNHPEFHATTIYKSSFKWYLFGVHKSQATTRLVSLVAQFRHPCPFGYGSSLLLLMAVYHEKSSRHIWIWFFVIG